MSADITTRLQTLRQQKAALEARRDAAEQQRKVSEDELKTLGWDGSQPPAEFVAQMKESADQAQALADDALKQAENSAAKFMPQERM